MVRCRLRTHKSILNDFERFFYNQALETISLRNLTLKLLNYYHDMTFDIKSL